MNICPSSKRLLVITLVAGSLIACGAPDPAPAAPLAQPAAVEPTSTPAAAALVTETKTMTETTAITDTAMSDSTAMTETAAMTATAVVAVTPAPTEEVILTLQGSLVGLGDGQHEGSGNVEISGEPGAYTLKFTNFSSSEGPDLHVILSRNADPINEKIGTDWLDLGLLQATSGDQEYALPADADLAAYQSVVVYCVTYDFVFSAATLQ
jgi:Electron transfer DM13